MDPTSKFELALPLVLLPISTQLSALHAARTPRPSLPCSCPRCGSELTTSTRVVRSKSSTHLLHTVCRVCGGTTSIPIDLLTARGFPSWRKLRSRPHPSTIQAQVTSNSRAVEGPVTPSLASKSPAALQHACPKPKKKPGLRDMLQRNRDKEKMRTQMEETKPAGLSAFLSTL